MLEDGSCGVVIRRQLKRSSLCSDRLKRSSVFLKGKIGVIPSVAAPADTSPSEATVNCIVIYISWMSALQLHTLNSSDLEEVCDNAIRCRIVQTTEKHYYQC